MLAMNRVRNETIKQVQRTFFTKSSAMPSVTLDEEFPNVPSRQGNDSKAHQTTTSVAPSGLRLASDNGDKITTLSVVIGKGSRNETNENAGVSVLASKLAFRCTEQRSDLRLYRDIENIGGVIASGAGKDYVSMSISVLPDKVHEASEILAESLLSPRFADWDVELQKQRVQYDIEAFNSNPIALLKQGVHEAAYYDDRTLGRCLYASDNLDNLTSCDLKKFHQENVNTGTLALVGTGIEHNTLTDVANQYFASIPKGEWQANQPAKYVGGEYRQKAQCDKTYVAVGFEGANWSSDNLATSYILSSLLDYRLAGKHGGAFNAVYEDSGIFGVSGCANADESDKLVATLINELKKVSSSAVAAGELNIAKAKSTLGLTDLYEKRDGSLCMLASYAAMNKVYTSSSIAEDLNAVSAKDIQAFAAKLLGSKPSIASVGNLSKVPRYDQVIKMLK